MVRRIEEWLLYVGRMGEFEVRLLETIAIVIVLVIVRVLVMMALRRQVPDAVLALKEPVLNMAGWMFILWRRPFVLGAPCGRQDVDFAYPTQRFFDRSAEQRTLRSPDSPEASR
jgi:hypothetical protein